MSKCIDHGKKGTMTGYLQIRYGGKIERAHRVAYCFARGIPIEYIQGSVVRHTCDNPRCINPQHLLVGTQQDNIADMMERGRHVTLRGMQQGNSVLTEKQVLFIREHHVYNSRQWGANAISRMLSVSPRTVRNVIHGHAWTHI